MRYRTLTRDDPDSFAHLLNGCAKDGYRVVSAGASYNPIRKKFEWWAVLERGEEAQQTPEAPKIKPEELEVLRKISEECSEKEGCTGCRFSRGNQCLVSEIPLEWGI